MEQLSWKGLPKTIYSNCLTAGRADQKLKHAAEYLHGKATIACWDGHKSFPRFWSFRSTPRGFLEAETDIRVRKEGAGHCLHGEELWDLAHTSAVSDAR